MTVDDIRRAAPGLHIPEAFAPILDMTGRDQKLLTSSSGLLTPTVGIELVEQTEARKLARRAQSDLAAFVEEWKTLEERKAWLGMETHQRQQEIDEPEREFASLQMFSVVLDDVCQAVRDRQWDPVISCLKKVATSLSAYNEELSSIAVASIHPFLAQAVQGWQPLEDPNLGNFTTDIREIKALLSPAGNVGSGATVAKCDHTDDDAPRRLHARSTTPYETMIYKIVFPKLATSVSQAWDAHDATPLLAVLERWEQLLPEFVRSQLLEQVVRKLESTMASWKPKKEQSTPPHLWLFPWLQHLPSHHLEPRGTGLVSEVRRKFRQTIDTWPFEKGVIPGLKQWRDVFRPSKTQDQWKPLVMHHILPSMGRYLRTHFRVDPGDQEPYLKILQGIVKWVDVISSSMVAEVIVTEVFPMWHDVLHQWLTSEDANYGEIGAWFEWWHGEVFPAEISSQDGIKTEFQRGAAMIETALELGDEVNHRLARPEKHPIRDIEPEAVEERQPKPPVLMPPSEVKQPTFRAEVEIWCEENDLRFIPVHKTNDLGKHYFRLTARLDGKGGVLVYFRGDDDALVAESRKINGVFRRNNKIEWDALLVALFEEVEGIKKK
ncbi:GC-rich sequence DNA-binding factor-like protein-domain-containing protein [Nemania sp. NC0429]|nr:GC-rich sequence DNA-binding factor-like protein-domain-containing protein [Nemania sp. NC0429]